MLPINHQSPYGNSHQMPTGMTLRSGKIIYPFNHDTNAYHATNYSNHTHYANPRLSPSVTEESIRDPHRLRETYLEQALSCVASTQPEILKQIENLIEKYFLPNSNEINAEHFTQHPWNQPNYLDESSTFIMKKVATTIANSTPNDSIQDAIQATLSTLTEYTSLHDPITLFVYDTETNRLFGDAITLGWASLSIDQNLQVDYQEGQFLLPPNFITYGAQRVHHISLNWLQEEHQKGHTTSQEAVLLDWLTRVLDSQSAAGFNVLFDLNVMKRLAHRTGLQSKKVEALFHAIGLYHSIDAQDFLLRIDYQTRHDFNIPFQNTKRHIEVADKLYDNIYPNGDPIEFHTNKKLTTYANQFLGMDTEGAHDAQYDSRMTLATLLFSMGLRNNILDNESTFTRQSDKRLTSYNRTLSPSEVLSRKLYPNNYETESMYSNFNASRYLFPVFDSLDDKCPHNPTLKATPFIFIPTGTTIHRRHIIPKSTIAAWLNLNDPIQKNEQFHTILNHILFDDIAEVRLSSTAFQLCQYYRDFLHQHGLTSEYFPDNIIETTADLLSSLEYATEKNLNIRYFERPPASIFLEGLPSSQVLYDFLQSDPEHRHDSHHPIDIEQMNKIMNMIFYSFFHSLEFNQFIGHGADNIVAGMLFHSLHKIEGETLNKIDNAHDFDELKSITTHWFEQIKKSLIFNINDAQVKDNDIFDTLSQAIDLNTEDFTDTTINAKLFSDEQLIYFLEIKHCVHGVLETFFQFTPLQSSDIIDIHQQTLDSLMNNSKLLFGIINFKKSKNAFTFNDRDWLLPLLESDLIAYPKTIKYASDEIKISAVENFYLHLDQVKLACTESQLYEGDQERLLALIDLLFYTHNLQPNLMKLEVPNADSLSDFSSSEDTPSLASSKKSITLFAKSLYDSSSYDLPSSGARALQNSYLLPIYQNYLNHKNDHTELSNSSTQSLIDLMEADHFIGLSLNIDRNRDNNRPLYNPMMNYLYG